jgi:hypothetical protein
VRESLEIFLTGRVIRQVGLERLGRGWRGRIASQLVDEFTVGRGVNGEAADDD